MNLPSSVPSNSLWARSAFAPLTALRGVNNLTGTIFRPNHSRRLKQVVVKKWNSSRNKSTMNKLILNVFLDKLSDRQSSFQTDPLLTYAAILIRWVSRYSLFLHYESSHERRCQSGCLQMDTGVQITPSSSSKSPSHFEYCQINACVTTVENEDFLLHKFFTFFFYAQFI